MPHPVRLLEYLPQRRGFAFVRNGDGLVGWGELARIAVGQTPESRTRAAAEVRELLLSLQGPEDHEVAGSGPVAFGSFTFDAGEPGSVLVVPRMVLGQRAGRAWLTVLGGGDPQLWPPEGSTTLPRVRWRGSTTPEELWVATVEDAVKRIRAGELDKVVLARDLCAIADRALPSAPLARRLAEHFPGCWTYVVNGLVGATPELLARRRRMVVDSLVLAGTAPRSGAARVDAAAARTLAGSAKNLSEHAFAVDSVRDVLAGILTDVHLDPAPRLLSLENVTHLATHIRGHLPRGSRMSALEVALALHPTAAVGGVPREPALDLIRRVEPPRGRYAGPIGWVDARGDGEWGIALRCVALDGPRARLHAGAGIVADSDPAEELAEIDAKLRAVRRALGGLNGLNRLEPLRQGESG